MEKLLAFFKAFAGTRAKLASFNFPVSACIFTISVFFLSSRKADVIARGFSGYNTRQCKALLPYLENDVKDATVVGVFLGANDANDPVKNPQQSVPIDEYKNNLKDIVAYFKVCF